MSPLFSLLLLLLLTTVSANAITPTYREAPSFQNGLKCTKTPTSTIHISMTLDIHYLRGSIAGILSILKHASCPQNMVFHFLVSHQRDHLHQTILTTFPYLNFHFYNFDTNLVRNKISSSIRRALDQPLNYARIYLPDLVPTGVHRVIYFDSDVIIVDDIEKLWSIELSPYVIGAPEYCNANFTHYFTEKFWSNPIYSQAFKDRKPCYFNTGVMVIDVAKWRRGRYTEKLEQWMKLQKRFRIYELGSLPPFLLVFAGDVKGVEHRWNQHGLGGDNIEGLCRDLHPGPVSLLHWSGKGKPWLRLDSKKACPLDKLWAPYDLFRQQSLFPDT